MREIMPEVTWMALAMCILSDKPRTADQAINELVTDPRVKARERIKQDSADMGAILTELRAQGYTYKQIGLIYNMSADAVHKRIKRFKKV